MKAFEEERIVWEDDAPDAPETAKLEGDRRAEVAIVGAGFTGLWAALHLALRGVSVTVLEAREIGHGGSGRNVGLVNAGLWSEPVVVEQRLGPDYGYRLSNALAHGPRRVFAEIARHRIDAEAKQAGTLYLAHDLEAFEDLRLRRDQLRGRRRPAELLGRAETAERTGTNAYHGALLDPSAGTVNPLGLARGIARAAIVAGATIHTNTRIEDARRVDDKWRLVTSGGRVTADRILLATNAYSMGVAEAINRAVIPVTYFQVATRPLRIAPAERILPGGEGAWDTGTVMTSFRRDAAGRLILGSIGKLPRGRPGVHGAWALRRIETLFPDLGPVEPARAWSGTIALTDDNVPRFVELAPGMVALYGYNGRGIAPSLVLGTAAADYLLDGNPAVMPLPVQTDARFVNFRDFRSQLAEIGTRLWHVSSDRS